MKTFIIVLAHLIVWPLFFYGLGFITWSTLISDEGKKMLKKEYGEVMQRIKKIR